MRRSLNYLLVLILIVAVMGGYWLYRSRATASTAANTAASYTQTVSVQRGNLNASIKVVGQLDAAQRADLAFSRMSGTTKLLTLDVAAGNTVKQGQTLATIDPAPYQQALDQATSDLQAAEEKLADLKTPATQQEIAQADVAVAQAAQQVEQAKSDLADLKSPDLTSLKAAVQDAQDTLTVAQLQKTLSERNAVAKSVRDLQYAVNWHQRKIAQLQQLVAENKANLEQKDQIASEQDALGQAQADLARAQAEQQLSLRAAAAEIDKDQIALADAQDALKTAQAGGDKLALAKAQLAVKSAEVALAKARDDRAKLDEGTDATTLAAAQADVDKKRLAVADAQAALDGAKLVAPFDGTVLKTSAQVGETISANTTILTVANLKELQVLAAVDETTIRRVTAGQTAQITFDAFPGQTFTSAVLSVPLQGTLQGGVMVYEVPVSLTGADKLPLLVGMTANVAIQVGQAQNALLVPALALQKINGMYQALVPNTADPTGQPETVPVEVGLSDGVNTQILRGLNEGDQVIAQLQTSQTNRTTSRAGGGLFSFLGGGRFGR